MVQETKLSPQFLGEQNCHLLRRVNWAASPVAQNGVAKRGESEEPIRSRQNVPPWWNVVANNLRKKGEHGREHVREPAPAAKLIWWRRQCSTT